MGEKLKVGGAPGTLGGGGPGGGGGAPGTPARGRSGEGGVAVGCGPEGGVPAMVVGQRKFELEPDCRLLDIPGPDCRIGPVMVTESWEE